MPNAYVLTIHLTGDEFGHRLNHAHCLFVEVGVHTTHYLYFAYRAVFLNHELYDNAALNVVLCGNFGIADVLVQVFVCLLYTSDAADD